MISCKNENGNLKNLNLKNFELDKDLQDFDWSQTKIVFVSPKFTQYQIDATSYGIIISFNILIIFK